MPHTSILQRTQLMADLVDTLGMRYRLKSFGVSIDSLPLPEYEKRLLKEFDQKQLNADGVIDFSKVDSFENVSAAGAWNPIIQEEIRTALTRKSRHFGVEADFFSVDALQEKVVFQQSGQTVLSLFFRGGVACLEPDDDLEKIQWRENGQVQALLKYQGNPSDPIHLNYQSAVVDIRESFFTSLPISRKEFALYDTGIMDLIQQPRRGDWFYQLVFPKVTITDKPLPNLSEVKAVLARSHPQFIGEFFYHLLSTHTGETVRDDKMAIRIANELWASLFIRKDAQSVEKAAEILRAIPSQPLRDLLLVPIYMADYQQVFSILSLLFPQTKERSSILGNMDITSEVRDPKRFVLIPEPIKAQFKQFISPRVTDRSKVSNEESALRVEEKAAIEDLKRSMRCPIEDIRRLESLGHKLKKQYPIFRIHEDPVYTGVGELLDTVYSPNNDWLYQEPDHKIVDAVEPEPLLEQSILQQALKILHAHDMLLIPRVDDPDFKPAGDLEMLDPIRYAVPGSSDSDIQELQSSLYIQSGVMQGRLTIQVRGDLVTQAESGAAKLINEEYQALLQELERRGGKDKYVIEKYYDKTGHAETGYLQAYETGYLQAYNLTSEFDNYQDGFHPMKDGIEIEIHQTKTGYTKRKWSAGVERGTIELTVDYLTSGPKFETYKTFRATYRYFFHAFECNHFVARMNTTIHWPDGSDEVRPDFLYKWQLDRELEERQNPFRVNKPETMLERPMGIQPLEK